MTGAMEIAFQCNVMPYSLVIFTSIHFILPLIRSVGSAMIMEAPISFETQNYLRAATQKGVAYIKSVVTFSEPHIVVVVVVVELRHCHFRRRRRFLLCHGGQTKPGAHPTSCSIDTAVMKLTTHLRLVPRLRRAVLQIRCLVVGV
jgi:hypothetical protein